MVGFDDIVQIFDLPMPRFLQAFAFGLQFRDRDPVGRRFVGVDDLRLFPGLQAVERFAEEALRRLGVPSRREIEVDRVSFLVERPVQIGPFAAKVQLSLVDYGRRHCQRNLFSISGAYF
jgi:hypothetical protein